MGIKEKTFKQIPEAIKAVAGRFITVFVRRLDFLKTRRGNTAHSDFLLLLENKIDQTNFKEWSRDQMVATLFLAFADFEMSKVVTELMNKDSGLNMVELGAQIGSLESSTWYKGAKKESANLSGATGGAPPSSGGKWCSGCQRSTHNTVVCYGICKWCQGRKLPLQKRRGGQGGTIESQQSS